jgi:hypothetical protein
VSDYSLFPIAVIEDRYMGSYSKGEWIAVACWDDHAMDILAGPHGDDIPAMIFWEDPPKWIAAGATPDEAIASLRAKQ